MLRGWFSLLQLASRARGLFRACGGLTNSVLLRFGLGSEELTSDGHLRQIVDQLEILRERGVLRSHGVHRAAVSVSGREHRGQRVELTTDEMYSLRQLSKWNAG